MASSTLIEPRYYHQDLVVPAGTAIATPVSWIAYCGCTPLAIAMALGLIVLIGVGIIAAANSEMKPLPVIGKIVLIKPLPEAAPKPDAPPTANPPSPTT